MTAARLTFFGGRVYLALIYLLVIGPMAIIVVDSFNTSPSVPAPWEGFTLRWYIRLLNNESFMHAIQISVIVAVAAATIATLLGLSAGYALTRFPLRGRDWIGTYLMGPLFVPQIVIGLITLQLFSQFGFKLTVYTSIAAHVVYVMPFTLRLILPAFQRFDFALEDAAQSLGADRLRTWWYVILPLIKTGVIAGFVFAFILSFANLPLSMFLTGPQTATLPVIMFSYMESRLDPLITAVSSIVVIVSVVSTLTLERVFGLRLLG
jgi:putative spermidine/putrescine transport system permease protein